MDCIYVYTYIYIIYIYIYMLYILRMYIQIMYIYINNFCNRFLYIMKVISVYRVRLVPELSRCFFSFCGGKVYTVLPLFCPNKQNSNLNPFCKVGDLRLWLLKITCFTSFLLQIKPVIIKTINFKFKNVPFTKLQKIKLNQECGKYNKLSKPSV